jgi:hypothetical protein
VLLILLYITVHKLSNDAWSGEKRLYGILERLDYGVSEVLTQALSGGTEEGYRICMQKTGCRVLNQTSREHKSMDNPFGNL